MNVNPRNQPRARSLPSRPQLPRPLGLCFQVFATIRVRGCNPDAGNYAPPEREQAYSRSRAHAISGKVVGQSISRLTPRRFKRGRTTCETLLRFQSAQTPFAPSRDIYPPSPSSFPLPSAVSGPSPPVLSPSPTPRSLDLASLSKRLNLRHRGEEDVALELLVRKLLLDVAEDGRDEVALLLLAELGLVADVRVEDRLDLGGDRGLLLQAEGLVLELGGLLLGRGNDLSIPN